LCSNARINTLLSQQAKKDRPLKKSAFFINFFVARQGAVVVHI
jgi:hypothetical protein